MSRSAAEADECASGAAEPPVIAAFLEFRVPTSRVAAGLGSSPLQLPPGGSCRTSTAPSPPGSIGRELGQRRTRQARRHGSDRRPPRRGRRVLPAVRGGSPRRPSAPLVAPTCRTRVRGYSGVQPRSGMVARSARSGHTHPDRKPPPRRPAPRRPRRTTCCVRGSVPRDARHTSASRSLWTAPRVAAGRAAG